MYFVGYGSNEYWKDACQKAMANEAYSEWETALGNSVEAEVLSGMNMIA